MVPVDVSTLEEVTTEDNPAVEESRMPIKLPKVPRLVAPYKYAAAWQCLRPLPPSETPQPETDRASG